MATNVMPSLYTLPVELFYRILDDLDTETILFVMQYVCKRFYSITANYNRYELNFKSISKHKFHQLCRVAHPQNVISLTLSNDDKTPGQIGLFLSLYHIEEYTRLQSVTLISIEESYLKIILEHLLTICSLTSLVIHCELNCVLSVETHILLSLVIGKNSLRKLDLALGYAIIDKLEWPVVCSIQYLKLFSHIRFDQFCTILRRSPRLKTMILRDCIINDIDELNSIISDTIPYRQLTSFTLEDCDLEMTMIESLLSLTPSLVHFTIIGNGDDLFDGARWEQSIQTKLLDLNKFEFAFQSNITITHDQTGVESLIAPFQTPFWLDTKRWFVTVLCIKDSPFINLYTTPDCASKINFHSPANKISCSTIPTTIKGLIPMDSVCEMSLNLIEMMVDVAEKEREASHRLFNKLVKLTLLVNGDWPIGSLELLSTFIDLTTINDLVLNVSFTLSDGNNTIAAIITLLKETSNIRSLIIMHRSATVPTICSILSYSVQHFEVPVNSVEDMKIILEEFEHLSSITFKFLTDSVTYITEMIEWLLMKGRDFTYQSTQRSLSLWLGKSVKKIF